VGPGCAVSIRIDSHGLRGPEPGPHEGLRWLALGDSFTFAAQVPEEETFTALLAAHLGQQVLNGGVDGDGTWQSTRRWLAVDRALRPDGLLLVFFLGNDLVDDTVLRERVVHGPPPGAPTVPRPDPSTLTRLLLAHSRLYAHSRVVLRRRLLQTDAPRTERWRQELSLFTRGGRQALETMAHEAEDALTELRDAAQARARRLVVATAPPAFVIEPERLAPTLALVGLDPTGATPDAPGQAVAAVLDGLGIAGCDLTPALQAAEARGERTYLTYDGHWSAAGHRVVADTLAGCLAR
jgi:lysophospholipase L1-like esterase